MGVDEARQTPAERIFVFGDGRLIAAGRPSVERKDISDEFGADATSSEFRVVGVLRGAARLADPDQLRVIGVANGRASELQVSGNAIFGSSD